MSCICGECRECINRAKHPENLDGYRPFDPHELRHAQLLIEINARCAENAKKHGGPEHDDTHDLYDWTQMINRYRRKAEDVIPYDEPLNYERYLIDCAALAVVGVLSSRRKRNA